MFLFIAKHITEHIYMLYLEKVGIYPYDAKAVLRKKSKNILEMNVRPIFANHKKHIVLLSHFILDCN